MNKLAIFLVLFAIIISGCNQQQAEISVLPERVEGSEEFVENGGPGITEATYTDEQGKAWNIASNKVSVPIQEDCEEPDVALEQDVPLLLPQENLVATTVAVTTYQNQLFVATTEKPDVRFKTEVFIPKNPPKIRLEKSTDQDVLCCNDQLTFRIKYINEGGDDAYNIKITDLVPSNVEYLEDSVGTEPFIGDIYIDRDFEDRAKKITWLIEGPVPPGGEGEVHFTVTCKRKRPKLTCVVCLDPETIVVGDEAFVVCNILNQGDGVATGAKLILSLPPEFEYVENPAQRELEFDLGDIGPQETATKQFKVKMISDGKLEEIISTVVIDNGEGCQCALPPTASLTIQKTGPYQLTNSKPMEHTIVVRNTSSTVSATECILVDTLPQGIKFEEASNNGQYDATSNTVTWNLGTLAPGTAETRTVTVIPLRSGNFTDNAQVSCAEGITVKDDATTIVKGHAAMHISKYDSDDPVAVGETTTYTIEVRNEGFEDATGIILENEIPELTEFVSASAEDPYNKQEIPYNIEGQKVIFNKLPLLSSGDKVIFNVTVRVSTKGQLLNRTSLRYDQFDRTLIVEEPTSTYE
ncbi:hypothetical protein [Candidatus Uabimicrobium sp. HlEnr_7]|uniref:hypothetical protein n=1 Tax=Candidatus Uabimicrobium helgolandensis TaxID=3095367 RepID=UPI00355670BF